MSVNGSSLIIVVSGSPLFIVVGGDRLSVEGNWRQPVGGGGVVSQYVESSYYLSSVEYHLSVEERTLSVVVGRGVEVVEDVRIIEGGVSAVVEVVCRCVGGGLS